MALWAQERGIELHYIEPDRAGPELFRRELQRNVPGRVLEREPLHSRRRRRLEGPGSVEERQRETTSQLIGWAEAEGVRSGTGIASGPLDCRECLAGLLRYDARAAWSSVGFRHSTGF